MKDRDTGIGSVGQDLFSVSSNEQTWKNRLHKLASKYPNECIIKHEPIDIDDYITAWIPKNWISVRPPVKKNLTDEQRQRLRDNLKRTCQNSQLDTEISDADIPFASADGEILVEELDCLI